MLRKYGIGFYDLDLIDFCELVDFSLNEEFEIHLRTEWNSLYPFMCMNMIKFMSFEEYRDRRTGRNIDLRPAEDIIAEIEKLHGKEL